MAGHRRPLRIVRGDHGLARRFAARRSAAVYLLPVLAGNDGYEVACKYARASFHRDAYISWQSRLRT